MRYRSALLAALAAVFPVCGSSEAQTIGPTAGGSLTSAAMDSFAGAVSGTYGVLARNVAGQWAAYNQGFIDMNLYGASTASTSDATTLINTAAAYAKANGLALYFPCGTYNHANPSSTGVLFDSIKVYGNGKCSVLNATNTSTSNPQLTVFVQGNGTEVHDLNFTSANSAVRGTGGNDTALGINPGNSLTNFKIEGNYFTGTFPGAAIAMNGTGTTSAANGVIDHNFLIGTTLSNPMILQSNVTGLDVHDNTVAEVLAGDTCIELVDYTASAVSVNTHNHVHHNTLSNCGAHGISVVGGWYETIDHNDISSVPDRGVYIASEAGSTTSTTSHIIVADNMISNDSGDNGILVIGRSGFPTSYVSVNGNHILLNNSAYIGIAFGSSYLSEVTASGNVISGDGTHGNVGILANGVQDLTEENNIISGMQEYGLQNGGGNSGTFKAVNNHLSNLSLASAGTYPAISLNGSGFTHEIVSNNSYTAGANAVSYYLTCTSGDSDLQISGISGSTTTISGCSANMGLLSTLQSVQTASYTWAITDRYNYLDMNCSAACNLTVPPNSSVNFPVGQELCFSQTGSGTVTIVAGSGVNPLQAYGTTILNGQYASGCIKQMSANTWRAVGNFQ